MTTEIFKKVVSLLLITLLVLSLTACGKEAGKTNPAGYADQAAFLKDMAKGISDRLSRVDDEKHADDTPEQKAEYYKKLVGYELEQISKYENAVFADNKFNDLAHHYINACKMQYTGAENIRKTDLYTPLWNGGSTVRSGIITEMYQNYGLDLTTEQIASYSGNTGSYTVTIDNGNDTSDSKPEFDKTAVEKKLDLHCEFGQNSEQLAAFLVNNSDEVINAEASVKLYYHNQLVSAQTARYSNVLPGQTAASWVHPYQTAYDCAEIELASVSRAYTEFADGTKIDDLFRFNTTELAEKVIVECENIAFGPKAYVKSTVVLYKNETPVWVYYCDFTVDEGKTATDTVDYIKCGYDEVKVYVYNFGKTI